MFTADLLSIPPVHVCFSRLKAYSRGEEALGINLGIHWRFFGRKKKFMRI